MDASSGAPTLEFVGTATTVLRLGPFTLLTDPNFLHRGQYAYLGKGLVTRRLTEPSLQPDQLPPLDAVVLSHLHGDHFDRVARRRLARDLPVLTTPEAARRLARWGFSEADGLRTWDTRRLERGGWSLTLTAVPGTHAPSLLRPLLPPVMGTVLELTGLGQGPFRLYLSGDTLYRDALRQIRERTGPLDAAVLHLGGTKVLGVLVTMDGEQGARLTELLDPRAVVPVHHDDYTRFRSPLADFVVACRQRGLQDRIRAVGRGEVLPLRGE
jgi:L-ascorbate metabolism protein UlaG (beta-lactamase superfamily)